jgi:hypothetical protein
MILFLLFFSHRNMTTFANIPIICVTESKRTKIVSSEISEQDLEAFVLMHICFHRKVDQTHNEEEGGESEK